jgi:transcriptional regulator with XRE-family HTH domain
MKETLIEYVKRIMRQNSLTLRDIEENSGGRISNSYISKILNGNVKNPSADKIVALAKGLKVDSHEVFTVITGEGQSSYDPMMFADMIQKVASNPELLKPLREWLDMSEKERATMLHSLQFINDKRKKQKSKKKH